METIKNNMEDNLVIVLDLGNYKESCRESVMLEEVLKEKFLYITSTTEKDFVKTQRKKI